MIGERIGHLRVISSIGVGGMGAVWHAVDELLDRHVALKVIRPELLSRPGLAERFRSEAIVLARLQHPCIAALYGLEKRGDEFVMVMEFVDGQTLDHFLGDQGSLPWPEASRITRAVLDALDHAHESGVIHRDIKPANVMITRAGRVKVMDFGIARLVGAQRQTRTGAAVGTPSYMSPEQLLGQEVDGRADVYAVGTLLYELTTGHLPFEVEGDYLRMIAQLQQIPGAPSAHNSALPSGLDLIVARALQKEPDDRYATSGEFRDALEELEREHGVLRPYGTPAAGSTTVTSTSGAMRGTPAVSPAVSKQPTPNFSSNASALLTPVESAMSATPVPFSIEPAGATPIDLEVPASLTGAQAQAEQVPAPETAADTATEREAVTTYVGEVTKRRGLPRALLAAAAIAVVATVGVLFQRNVTARETQAAAQAARTPLPPVATAVVPSAPPAPVPVSTPVPVAADSVDSAAVRKAVADSARAARRARADSIRAVKDSLAKQQSVFALPSVGAAIADPAASDRANDRAGTDASIALARQCVSALNGSDLGRLESLLGGNRRNILRIAKDGHLDAGGPLQPSTTIEGNRVTTSFTANLRWKNSRNEEGAAIAKMRAVVERVGSTWNAKGCLVDNDGGARY
jgi:eukaryotic-like serine/threonine-protein kinase